MDRDVVLAQYTRHVNASLANLARLVCSPVEIEAHGTTVLGSDGRTYLDCGGFGVFLLGHCHPTVVAAVRRQLERNPLATRLFLNPAARAGRGGPRRRRADRARPRLPHQLRCGGD